MSTPGYFAPAVAAELRLSRVESALNSRAKVVASVSSSGLTAATAATTILIASKRRRYRANVLAFVTTGGDAINLTVNILTTDRVGAVTTAVIPASSINATTRYNGSLVLEADNAQKVQYSTTLSGARTVSVWALEIVLEELP